MYHMDERCGFRGCFECRRGNEKKRWIEWVHFILKWAVPTGASNFEIKKHSKWFTLSPV